MLCGCNPTCSDIIFFLSFFYILKTSRILSTFTAIIIGITLYTFIFNNYEVLFSKLKLELEKQREIILLSSITSVSVSNSQCEICYETIKNEGMELKCNCNDKVYHKDCILEWFKKKPNCPFCRQMFKTM
jgi:hypothetical protein